MATGDSQLREMSAKPVFEGDLTPPGLPLHRRGSSMVHRFSSETCKDRHSLQHRWHAPTANEVHRGRFITFTALGSLEDGIFADKTALLEQEVGSGASIAHYSADHIGGKFFVDFS